MVRITHVYTRKGDTGTTALGDGSCVPKTHMRVEVCGTLDEANAAIGLIRLYTRSPRQEVPHSASVLFRSLDDILARIQNDLFDCGAELCLPQAQAVSSRMRVTEQSVCRLENEIDDLNASLPALSSFVLPGGSPVGAHAHLARTVVRRAERFMWALHQQEPLNPHSLVYMNRLSDLLFVISRSANICVDAEKEGLWSPGAHQ